MTANGSKSKKRSGANSSSKPLEPFVLFLDRSLGKKIVAASLREAGAEVRIHDDYFPQDAKDEEWLPVVGQKSWIVITKDQRIRYRAAALAAVRQARVRLFTLTGKDLQGPEMARIIAKALPAMRRLTVREKAPFIAKITRGGSVSIWVRSRDLRRSTRT